MEVEFTPAALKALGKMPSHERAALIGKITDLAAGKQMTPKVHKAFTETTGRLRHGDSRAVYRIEVATDTIVIVAAGHRREVHQ